MGDVILDGFAFFDIWFEEHNLPVQLRNQLLRAYLEGYKKGISMAKMKTKKPAVKKPVKK